jgi:hypothetical protein
MANAVICTSDRTLSGRISVVSVAKRPKHSMVQGNLSRRVLRAQGHQICRRWRFIKGCRLNAGIPQALLRSSRSSVCSKPPRGGEGLDQVKERKSCEPGGDQRSWCALAYCVITSQTHWHIYTGCRYEGRGREEMCFRSSDATRGGEGRVR